MDLTNFKIQKAPPTIYYIPNFITNEEEGDILRNVYAAPKPKWTCLSRRRLQDYGGVIHEKGLIPEAIPDWLTKYIDKVFHLKLFDRRPNQVLVNEYLPGQGIMPHTDGPFFYPIVATITCGSHTVLEFLENDESRQKVCSLLLERCSLVIVQDDMYNRYLHTIEEVECDKIDTCANLDHCEKPYGMNGILKRGTRVSLTIRNVPKVLNVRLWK